MIEKYSWVEFNRDVERLAKKVKPYVPFLKSVYGFSKGGLEVAKVISDKLNIPLITERKKVNENTLVVDLLMPNHNFIKLLNDNTRAYHSSASLFCYKNSPDQPMFIGRFLKVGEFVKMPWQK